MSFEIAHAKRAMNGIDNPHVLKALEHICKSIEDLKDENEKLKNEINALRNRIRP